MPKHIRFMLRHAAYGAVIAIAFTALILIFDVAGIRHLVTHTTEGPVALAVFVVLCTITFGSVQIGMQIMTLGNRPDDGDNGNRAAVATGVPIPVEAGDRR